MVNNSTNINKANSPLSSSFTEHKNPPTTYDVAIAINVLAWDRHKNVSGLNQLMGPQFPSWLLDLKRKYIYIKTNDINMYETFVAVRSINI